MNTNNNSKHTNNGEVMLKKCCVIFIFLIILIRIFFINVINGELYSKMLEQKINTYVYGESSPRGRILDRNGVVLVDNVGIKTVFYSKSPSVNINDEIAIAYKLAEILNIKIDNSSLKKFWLVKNNNGDDLITEEEYDLYAKRKLNSQDLLKMKYDRISESDINSLNELDKESATIYSIMNKGYSYAKKEIIKDISDEEYSKIIDANITGISVEMSWERVYNYGNVLKDIFGTIGHIPFEKKDEYLKKGYQLNDIVGLSYLELQYENYLKGEKDIYKVNKDNTLSLLKAGKKGDDLILSIDIKVQLELEKLIQENIVKVKKKKYTDYFNEVYSIVGHPSTGEIIALSGQKLIENKFYNVNTNIINTSYTVGSVVKMATVSTGYKYNIIDIGTSFNDGCIKLYQVPLKCSYKDLGMVNDLQAISKSSNYYQFKIAIGLTDNKYQYNMKLNTTKNDFDKIRNVFKSYGLGEITGIDLPNETIGIIGSNTSPDLLLNLSIGQYDTYTPLEIFQYVNTVANNGAKKKPQLMKSIKVNSNDFIINTYNTVDKIDLEEKYLDRLREAMSLATKKGTARNYIESKYNPAGKTGTSETFVDTNNDGIMDKKTTSLAFVGFAPYDNPLYSIIVLAPNIYEVTDYEYNKMYITRYISNGITNFLFENY